MDLRNRVALVTGATHGIGAAIARALADEGVRLVLIARTADALDAIGAQLQARVPVLCVVCDVRDVKQVRDTIQRTITHYGSLDIVINNAGLYAEKPLDQYDEETFNTIMDVNVKGMFFVTQAALPHLRQSRGQIITMGSRAGLIGLRNQTLYCASKFAVEGFCRAVREEVKADGVRVTGISPGSVNTWGAEPATGLLAPEDVARAVMYALSTSDAAEVTDVIINPRFGDG